MSSIKLGAAFVVSFVLLGNVHAAGAPVNEDFTVVSGLCDSMIELAKKGSKEEFLETVDSALKLSEAQRRDNSMAIDRFRPKLRAAKKAGKTGDFNAAIGFVQQAKTLMKPATTSWDGGS